MAKETLLETGILMIPVIILGTLIMAPTWDLFKLVAFYGFWIISLLATCCVVLSRLEKSDD